MAKIVNKTVSLTLAGLDGNAWVLMGKFRRAAKGQNWTDGEVKAVLDECMSGDYNHLLRTLMEHCDDEDNDDRDDEYGDGDGD